MTTQQLLEHDKMCFYGMKVMVSPDLPKMQLSTDPKLMLPPLFRAEINEWMRTFFGVTNILKDNEIIEFGNGEFLTMNPRTYARIKALIEKDTS